jgi:hypothetical protein
MKDTNWGMVALTAGMMLWPIHLGTRHEPISTLLIFTAIQGVVFWALTRSAAAHIPIGYQIAFSQMMAATISLVGYGIGIAIS